MTAVPLPYSILWSMSPMAISVSASNNGFSVAGNDGGGIYANNSIVRFTSDQARIIWNQAGNYGGGVYAVDSTLNFNGAVVSNNSGMFSGGGFYLNNSSLSLVNATTQGNDVLAFELDQGGGGMTLVSGSDVSINGSLISGNSSANGGGAINCPHERVKSVLDRIHNNCRQHGCLQWRWHYSAVQSAAGQHDIAEQHRR